MNGFCDIMATNDRAPSADLRVNDESAEQYAQLSERSEQSN